MSTVAKVSSRIETSFPCRLAGISVFLTFSLLGAPMASAEVYLTESQAVKIAIPKADAISVDRKQLSEVQRSELQTRSGLRFPERQYKFFVGRSAQGHITGYAVIMNEIGKEEHITFIVGVNPQGQVSDVAIMEFRESRGWEVKEKRFLRQYRGKKSTDPVEVDRDITNYTGATLSTHAVTRGVKKALLLTDVFYLGKS